jgi:hypothetical protein
VYIVDPFAQSAATVVKADVAVGTLLIRILPLAMYLTIILKETNEKTIHPSKTTISQIRMSKNSSRLLWYTKEICTFSFTIMTDN